MASPDQDKPAPEDLPDFSQRVAPGYLQGVYLAVNALRDLYLLVEGPDCAHMKTQYIQGNHDWMSTLTSVSGFHRVANTALHPDQMSGSREEAVRGALMKLASHPSVPGVALTSLPMAYITGADYERIAEEVSEETGKPLVHIPGKSLSGDWLDGYAETLYALASQLDLSDAAPDPNKVAIIGNLFHRNEGDCQGNVAELRRLVQGLGLELCAIWLGGQDFAELTDVKDAGTIISLPYGRRAARKVARRTGATLVETALPMGLPASEAWVNDVAAALGREAQARVLLDRELAAVVPPLEWVIPFIFQTRTVGYVGDPYMLPGIASYLEMLGASLTFAVVIDPPKHTSELPENITALGDRLLVHPKMRTFTRFLSGQLNGPGGVDAMVTSSVGSHGHRVASLELGFPSVYRHALFPRPYLGFGGALAMANDLANAMRAHEVRLTFEGPGGGSGGRGRAEQGQGKGQKD